MISVLSGGVGAARLLRALRALDTGEGLCAVVNVGDDLRLNGLSICPDLDTVMYTLAGLNDDDRGWGLAGETWRTMARLGELGGENWFSLGDLDLATHLYRTQRLNEGATKTEVSAELASRLGLDIALVPVTDDDLATEFSTEVGPLGFQEYFVRHRHGVTRGGVDTAALSSKTMQVEAVPGLFFVGEAVDVTGWLGGYNFQWAWSSGWAAGQAA